MTPGYLAVTIEPGPNTEQSAFDEWYAQEHGPLRLRLPFITTGDRYKASDGRKPTWSAVYDVTDIAWLDHRIYSRLREERSTRETRVMSTFTELDRRIYRLLKTHSKPGYQASPAPVQLTESYRISHENASAFDQWYEAEHLAAIKNLPTWLRTRHFQLTTGGIRGMPPEGQVDCLVVHDLSSTAGISDLDCLDSQTSQKGTTMLAQITSEPSRLWTHFSSFDALREPPSSVITTDGAELRFQLEGNPADPVIVLVNSILTNLHIWDDVTMELLQGIRGKSYRVLRYNARGYTQQWEGSRDTHFDILADDLEYLLSRLRIDRASAVIGVSMGGVTAINFAIRHPALLERYVACDCNIAASPANTQAWSERIELAKTEGMSALASITATRWFLPEHHGSPNFQKVVNMIEPASIDGFVQNAAALCNYDLKANLAGIKTPGLLLAGSGDGKLPEAMQSFDLPSSSFVAVPDAGHLPMLENHDAFIQAIASFVT